MGRLTYLKNGRPCVLVNGAEVFGPVAERLHAYEETGFEPGEVHDLADRIGKFHLDRGRQNLEAAHDALNQKDRDELEHDTYGPLHKKIGTWMKADAEGRLRILPCKPGTTVFRVEYNADACDKCENYCGYEDPFCTKHFHLYPDPTEEDKERICPKHYLEVVESEYRTWGFDELGPMHFLTREEAEAALKELKGGRGCGEG